MTVRTDIHRPAEIVPADYYLLECLYQGVSEDMADAYALEMRYLDDELQARFGGGGLDQLFHSGYGYRGNHVEKGTCDHCGSHFAHGSVYVHTPTNDVIVVGHICAQKTMLPGTDAAERKRLLASKEAQRLKTDRVNREARELFVKEHPEAAKIFDDWKDTDNFVGDVHRRWHGDPVKGLSEKQLEALLKVPARRAEWAARDAERDAQRAAAEDCPTGRVEITGEVVKTDTQENDFGTRWVMTVRDDRGFLVWGTEPSSINVEKGNRVRFTATVTVSDRDPKFGFYKRPAKAEVI
jgi:hypothetical protein